jgi:uncharacterized cupin superfamily protein
MTPADCAGFKGGTGDARHRANDGTGDVVCLEIGDHAPGNTVVSRDHDIAPSVTAVALLP